MKRMLALGLILVALGCGGAGEDTSGWTKGEKGLRYLDVQEGTGEAARAGQEVSVRYTGRLARGGDPFDSNVKAPEPLTFILGARRVIAGWDLGLAGMKQGGKRKLFIPARLGYGSQGFGTKIPPEADLIFDVEVVKIADGYDGEKESAKWKKSATGLRHLDVQEGAGPPAKAGQLVHVHYTGRLAQGGMQFDSSLGRGPFKFVLGKGRVIKGWDEGVAGMKAGGKRKLFIPAELGYGERGSGDRIPPDADLVFDVELLEIEEKQ